MAAAGWEPDELAAVLEERGDLADAVVGTTSLRFRLEGARPMWVLAEDAFVPEDPDAGGSALPDDPQASLVSADAGGTVGALPHGSGGAGTADAPPVEPAAVVGDDPSEKSALVLSIYDHQSIDWGVDEVTGLLADTRGYAGGVEVLANSSREDRAIGPEHFTGWDDYDVVYVATHGDQLCDDDRCWTGLSLGAEILEVPPSRQEEEILAAYGYADTPGVAIARSGNRVLPVIEGEWLAAQYQGQLEDTLVYIQACSSARAGDLAAGLAGDRSVFFGWSNTAFGDEATPAAIALFTELSERGVTSTTAYQEVRDAGLHRHEGSYTRTAPTVGPGQATHRLVDGELQRVEAEEEVEVDAELLHVAPGTDLRVREVIELQDPEDGTRLRDGRTVPLAGSDDGAELPVRLEIDGVLDGEAPDFTVDLRVNGVGVADWLLATDGAEVDEETWAIEDTVTLPPDMAEADSLTLEATTELPEGGTSQHTVEIGTPDYDLIVDARLDTDIPTGFQEQARVSGRFPVTYDPQEGTWSGASDPEWADYDHAFSECPEASGILPSTSLAEVPRASIDTANDEVELDLRLDESATRPTIRCAGQPFEVHLSELEVIVTALVVAKGGVPGPGVDAADVLDMVAEDTGRFRNFEPGTDPGTYVLQAEGTASTAEWDMTGQVSLTLEPRVDE